MGLVNYCDSKKDSNPKVDLKILADSKNGFINTLKK